MLPIDQTLYDAALFTAAAALLTLIAFLFGSTRRRGLLPMVGLMAGGLVVLGLFNLYGGQIESPLAKHMVRETVLAVIAFGFIKVGVLFVLQTMLARRGIPRILDDFFFALALIAY